MADVFVGDKPTVTPVAADTVLVLQDGALKRSTVTSIVAAGVGDGVVPGQIAALQAEDIVLDGRLDTAETNITSQGGRLTTAEVDIDALQAADVALDGRLDAAEPAITALQGADTALDGRLDTAESTLTSHGGRLTTAEGEIDALQSATVAATIAATVFGQESTLAVEPTVADIGHIRVIDTLNVSAKSTPTVVMSALIATSAIPGQISALQAEDIALDGRLDTAESTLTSQGGRLTTAEGEIDALQSATVAATIATTVFGQESSLPVETTAADIAHIRVTDTLAVAEKATPLLVATAQIAATATTAPAGGDLFLGASSGIPRKWTAAQTAGVVYDEAASLGTGTALAKILGVTAAGAAAGRSNADAMTDLLATAGVPEAIGAAAITINPSTGGVARTIQQRSLDLVSIMDFIPAAEQAAIIAKTSTYDCTAAFQAAANLGVVVFVPSGQYIVGGGNTEITLSNGTGFYGIRNSSIIKGASDFITATSSEAAYKALFKGVSVSNISFNGLKFIQSSDSIAQSKIKLKLCSDIILTNFDTEENGTWDILLNTCTEFSISNFTMKLGISGVHLGVGIRVCGKSKHGRISNFTISGKTVTQLATGYGVQPFGDKWGSVGINVDCSNEDHIASNKFRAGHIGHVTDGVILTQAYTVSGVAATNWRAFATQRVDTAIDLAAFVRLPTIAISTNTLTISGLPGAGGVTYDIFYAYFGDTPESIKISNGLIKGMAYAGISVINGIKIEAENISFENIGDIAWDPEGTLDCSIKNSSAVNVMTSAFVPGGYGGEVIDVSAEDCVRAVYLPGDNGGGYQAFSSTGIDWGTSQYQGVITVGAVSGNNQTLTGTNTDFRFCIVGDRISITHTGASYSYLIITKTSDNVVIVDKTIAWNMDAPRTEVDVSIPTGATSAWSKTGFRPAPIGIQGDIRISGVRVGNKNSTGLEYKSIAVEYGVDFSINDIKADTPLCTVQMTNSSLFAISDVNGKGRITLRSCHQWSMKDVALSHGHQRGITLRGCTKFNVSNTTLTNQDRQGISAYYFVYGECTDGWIRNSTFIKSQGDAANGIAAFQEGKYDEIGNTVDTGTPGNTNITVSIADIYTI